MVQDGKTRQRSAGRPRRFEDQAVFEATSRVVSDHGYAGFTIDAVAREIGCTPPALVARFGSRNALLRSYLEWTNQVGRERFRRAREEHASPMEALRARFRIPARDRPDEVAQPRVLVNLIVFHIAAWEDPLLRDQELARKALFEEEVMSLLDASIAAGELLSCNTARLAQLLIAMLTGVALQWVSDQERLVEDGLVDAMDDFLAPYRIVEA